MARGSGAARPPGRALTRERKLPDGVVNDLTVTNWDASSIMVRWTQVDDGRGRPARYRVRYSPAPIHTDAWSSESFGCDVRGDEIGAEISCTVNGLASGTAYEFRLMSYRMEDGVWVDAGYSNVAAASPLQPSSEQ